MELYSGSPLYFYGYNFQGFPKFQRKLQGNINLEKVECKQVNKLKISRITGASWGLPTPKRGPKKANKFKECGMHFFVNFFLNSAGDFVISQIHFPWKPIIKNSFNFFFDINFFKCHDAFVLNIPLRIFYTYPSRVIFETSRQFLKFVKIH